MTEAVISPAMIASQAFFRPSTPTILIWSRLPAESMTARAASAMSSEWKKPPTTFGKRCSRSCQSEATIGPCQSPGCSSTTLMFGYASSASLKPWARPCAPVWASWPWVWMTSPSPPIALKSSLATVKPM